MFTNGRKPSRLGHGNGRWRAPSHDHSLRARLLQPRNLARVGLAFAAAVACTAMAAAWDLPLPYRAGQVCQADLRARVSFEVVNETQTALRREEVVEQLPPEERQEPALCEAARQAEPAVTDTYPQGTPLVLRGQPITDQQLTLLEHEDAAYREALDPAEHARRGAALFLVMGLLAVLVSIYVVRFQAALAQSLAKITAVCLLVILTVALGLALSGPPWHAVLVPLTVAALVLTLAYNPQFALLLTLSLSLAVAVALDTDPGHVLVQMGGLATAILMLRNVRTRTRLVEVGLGAGLAYLAMTVATGLLSGQTAGFIAADAGRRLAWGALAGFLVSGCLPLVERCFGIVTDVRLLELADGSHPLLQELLRRAPGTYTHSMTVATLAEAAAEAVGANPLLARVGSYFHDVGKMLKPQYFVENQAGENRHDDLEPALSALIIFSHVKDGLALAKQYRLPKPIQDMIAQHHGTTLVEYFYREAMRLHEGADAGPPQEPAFRYPGPKPQNRENAIVMLADAVESSGRALGEPTPSSLRKLVHDLLMKRLLDGQFEQSGLTLTELHRIEESLCKGLIAAHHGRIRYPEWRAHPAAS